MRTATRCTIAAVTAAPLVAAPALLAEAAADVVAGPARVGARSAFLLDLGTGRPLWARAADTRRPIGSITKVMTALVVLRAGGLDRKITIKRKYVDYAARRGASSAQLRVGDRLTVRQLLHGMLLASGCDAAYALADTYGPGWPGFVAKMNKTARRLRLTGTHYSNFDGLPWPAAASTHSTARDLVKLGRNVMTRPVFRAIVARKAFSVPPGGGHHAYRWPTTNLLLGSYRGAIGIKTGYTDAAGYSLLFAARRNRRTLIGVVLNSSTTVPNARFTDAMRILNWAYGARTPVAPAVRPPVPGANID